MAGERGTAFAIGDNQTGYGPSPLEDLRMTLLVSPLQRTRAKEAEAMDKRRRPPLTVLAALAALILIVVGRGGGAATGRARNG